VTSIVCLCYPLLFLTQKMAFGKYHDRFKDKGPTLKYPPLLHPLPPLPPFPGEGPPRRSISH